MEDTLLLPTALSKPHPAVLEAEGRRFRISQVIDSDVVAFEQSLLTRSRTRPQEEGPESSRPIELTVFQQSDWYRHVRKEIRVVQVWDKNGDPSAQLIAEILRPKGLGWFSRAYVPSFGCAAVSHEDEISLLRNLPSLLKKSAGVMSVGIRAYRPDLRDVMDFEDLARRAGYRTCEPTSFHRTAIYEMKKPLEELLSDFDKKTRAKIRHSQRSGFRVLRLDDPKWLPQLQNALQGAFLRTDTACGAFDFEPVFGLARENPSKAHVVGFFFDDRPEELLAYMIGVRHGKMAEAFSCGALQDPELRKLPYNYILHWELIRWAHEYGSETLDLGGITDGGDSDPLARVSEFKRRFTRQERSIARDAQFVLSPTRCAAYRLLCAITGR